MKLIIVTVLMALLAAQASAQYESDVAEVNAEIEPMFNPIREIICVGRLLDDVQRTFNDYSQWIRDTRNRFNFISEQREYCENIRVETLRNACLTANSALQTAQIGLLLVQIRERFPRFPREVEQIIRSFESCRSN